MHPFDWAIHETECHTKAQALPAWVLSDPLSLSACELFDMGHVN